MLECNPHIQHQNQSQTSSQIQHTHHSQQGIKQSNNMITNTSLDGSNLVTLLPASQSSLTLLGEKSQTHVSSTSSNSSNSLNSMLQQGVNNSNSHVNMVNNLLSPSKPQNISELSNCSMVSSSSGSSTLDSSSAGNISNGTPTTKRSRPSKSIDHQKDGKYFERRKRNNVAAKKSRDARKQREDEIAIRASFLEKENSILKAQLQTLKDEAQQLRILLAQKKSSSLNGANCSNCTNCTTMNGVSSKQTPIGLINNAYINPNLASLTSQLTGYEHSDALGLDKSQNNQHGAQQNSSLTSASLYLQHQNPHRHQII